MRSHSCRSSATSAPSLELVKARGETARLNGVISDERDQVERTERERKNLMEVLERGGYFHRKKRARTDSTGGDAPRKP